MSEDGKTVSVGVRSSRRKIPCSARILGWIGRTGFRVLFRTKVEGLERARDCPPGTVVIANHVSYLDAAALAVFLPFEVTFAVNGEIARRWWVRIWFGVFSAVPVHSNRASALKALIRAGQEGRNVMIFPEGRISVTGGLMRTWPGALRVARAGSGRVLPVAVEGALESVYGLDPRRRRRWFPSLRLRIGSPQIVPETGNDSGWLYDRLLAVRLDGMPSKNQREGVLRHVYCLHRFQKVLIAGLSHESVLATDVRDLRQREKRPCCDLGAEMGPSTLGSAVYNEWVDCLIVSESIAVAALANTKDPSLWISVDTVMVVSGRGSTDGIETRLQQALACRIVWFPLDWEGIGWGALPDPWIPGRKLGLEPGA